MPVYNAEAYLKEAIDSILSQTFSDFEFIILNDGSTDTSETIIKSYTDPRIRYLPNERNEGLSFTLNKGVAAAQGKYIARMDGDDISLPNRFEKQVHVLQKQGLDIVASVVRPIDSLGQLLPNWKADVETITDQQIRNYLPKDNCVAHPTVLGKTELFKNYPYQQRQRLAEDYDLWLRLVADGYRIEKIPEPLVLHRILTTSFTRTKKVNLFWGLARVKIGFFMQQAKRGRLSGFTFALLFYACLDLLKAAGKEVKALFKR